MRTAIDTNIISGIWSNELSAAKIAHELGEARTHGALLIAPAVYAELLAYPKATEAFVYRFLSQTGITVDFNLEEVVWPDAGRRFARYASSKSRHGEPKRLLVDFLVGSHVLLQADRLMSLDGTRYRLYFPEFRLV